MSDNYKVISVSVENHLISVDIIMDFWKTKICLKDVG